MDIARIAVRRKKTHPPSSPFKRLVAQFLALSLMGSTVLGQAPPPTAGASTDGKPAHPGGPRRQVATIIYAGLGGSILGLSTLSFYGRPQDKLANIPIGFAIGVIAGAVIMTYRLANNPADLYAADFDHTRPHDPQLISASEGDLLQNRAGANHPIPLNWHYRIEF